MLFEFFSRQILERKNLLILEEYVSLRFYSFVRILEFLLIFTVEKYESLII